MVKVREWLESHGLASVADRFEREQIDWEALRLLTVDDVRELGLPVGPRAKLIAALRTLADPGAPPSNPAQAAPQAEAAVSALGAQGERRQLTALFCDMVGFTELANRLDPEVLQRIVSQYEEACAVCVARFEGYVFQLLGDGVVAFFGYPLAHEGEAERAIHSGLQIIETLAEMDFPEVGRLAVRIGIATGVVVVSQGGKGAVGETMNLAARLQALAEPGSVVVSEPVYRLAGGSFVYHDLGEQKLKGIAGSRRAYRIAGVSAEASRFAAATRRGMTPLIGREQEVGLLLERWALACEGEDQVVVLSGEPGMGKSRLLSVLQERVVAQGGQSLSLQCSPYYRNSALWPTSNHLERLLRFERTESPESKLAKLEELIVGELGRPRVDVGYIASMMSIPSDDRYGTASVTSHRRKQETMRSLIGLIEAVSRKRPTLMLFEDLQWADPTTLEVVDLLIQRDHGVRLMIVATHRPEFPSRWSDRADVCALQLSRLSRAQAAAMVSRLTGGKALPGTLFEQILGRTDGVPLYVEELTRSILESGQLVEREDRYDFTSSAEEATIPATLRDSLMARLDRFNPVKEIAQIGAAIGRTFGHELIAAVAPMSPARLDASLAQLVDSGLAHRRGTPPAAEYTFKHGLVQDVAYDSLLRSQRQQLHAKIARVIEERFPNIKLSEPEVLARHLTVAGETAPAVRQWHSAGERALKQLALTEAISHLNQGLRLVATLAGSADRDRLELSLRRSLSAAWMAARGWPTPQARESLLPALQLTHAAQSGLEVLPVYWGLFSNTLSQGRVAESEHWARELLAMAEQRRDSDMLVTAHLMMAVCTFWQGELAVCCTHADAVAALYDPVRHHHIADVINHDPLTGAAVYRAQVSWMLGYPDRAARECDAKDAHARSRGHVFDTGFALAAGADVFEYRGEPAAQRERVQACERLGQENGLQVLSHVMAPLRFGAAHIRDGQPAEGVALLRAGLQIRESGGGFGGSNPYLRALLAEGLGMLGDVSGALHVLEQLVEQIERPGWGERCHYAEIRRLEGWLFELRGDVEAAEASYRLALDWARRQQARSWELRTATSMAALWQRRGHAAQARELLAPVYGWFTEGFDTRDLVRARQLLASLG